jgi:putative FmdB family regulatory protein
LYGGAVPIYEYRCTSCGFQKEYLQKMTDPVMSVCPECKKQTFSKMLTAAGFHLKGSGWYATDFKSSGARPAAKADAKDTGKPDAKDTAKPDGKDTAKPDGKDAAKPDGKDTAKSDGKDTAKSDGKDTSGGKSESKSATPGASPASS